MLFKKKKKEDDFDSDLGSPFDLDNKKDSGGLGGGDLFSDQKLTNSTGGNFSSGLSDTNSSLDELHSKGFSQQGNASTNMNNASSIDSKDFQILNSKLDSIKSELDALSQHVLKIERDIDSDIQNKESVKKKPMW